MTFLWGISWCASAAEQDSGSAEAGAEVLSSLGTSGVVSVIGAVVSVAVLAVNLWRMRVERQRRNVDRGISVRDQFWVRTVIFPMCFEPLVEFIFGAMEEIDSIPELEKYAPTSGSASNYDLFLQDFQYEKGKISNRLFLVRLIDYNVYSEIAQELDVIEDEVSNFCWANSRNAGRAENGQESTPLAVQSNLASRLERMLSKLKQYQDGWACGEGARSVVSDRVLSNGP